MLGSGTAEIERIKAGRLKIDKESCETFVHSSFIASKPTGFPAFPDT
jgi:hypothetical protein